MCRPLSPVLERAQNVDSVGCKVLPSSSDDLILPQTNLPAYLVAGRAASVAVPAGLGLTAVTGQIVLIRETVVLFNGNELSLGVFLAIWLMWTAAGSALGSRWAQSSKHLRASIARVECANGFSLIAAVWILREARAHMQTVPGELLGPVPIVLVSLASLSLFCLLSGGLFALSAEMYSQSGISHGHMGSSHAYLLETAGSAFGGILTSVLLLPLFGSFQIAVLVALLNLCVCWTLIATKPREITALTVTSIAVGMAVVIFVMPRLETTTQQALWPGFQVIESRDSIYGRITVLNAGRLRSIYDDGTILADVPNPAKAEETVHYALLEHPAPRSLLLVGGGINGSIAEALKHLTLQRIDYVELDPALIAMYRRHFPEESAHAFNDARVRIHQMDGRLYLKMTKENFDVIVLGVPEPENAQLNRFYTEEFFRIARGHLAPGGLLALQLRSSEDAISPELADFIRCIDKTLRRVFPYTAVIPGDTLHLFGAFQQGVLTEDPQLLIARLKSRNLQTLYVREYFIPYRMASDRMAQIHELLQPLATTETNRDFYPAAYYFGGVLWSSQFTTAYPALLECAKRIRFSALLVGVVALALALLFAWCIFGKRRRREAMAWSLCATGYTAMATQVLLLLVFQSLFGHVYRELALLIGLFMAGMALGTWTGILCAQRTDGKRLKGWATGNQILLAAAAPLILGLAGLLSLCPNTASELSRAAFSVLATLCGFPGGYQFSIGSAIYHQGCSHKAGSGTLYGFDLLGGCAGALVLSAFLIPVFGFWKTAWLSAVVGLSAALMLALAKSEYPATLSLHAGVPQIRPQ